MREFLSPHAEENVPNPGTEPLMSTEPRASASGPNGAVTVRERDEKLRKLATDGAKVCRYFQSNLACQQADGFGRTGP